MLAGPHRLESAPILDRSGGGDDEKLVRTVHRREKAGAVYEADFGRHLFVENVCAGPGTGMALVKMQSAIDAAQYLLEDTDTQRCTTEQPRRIDACTAAER